MVVLLKRISQRHIRLILKETLTCVGRGCVHQPRSRFRWLPGDLLVYRMKYPPLQRYAGGVRICDILFRRGSLDS